MIGSAGRREWGTLIRATDATGKNGIPGKAGRHPSVCIVGNANEFVKEASHLS